MQDPITSVLATRAGALRYPKQAAAALSAASDVNSVITGDILGTVPGVLRFPNEAASALSLPASAIDWQFARDKSLTAAVGSNVSITRASIGNYFNASGVLTQAAIDEPRWNHVVINDSLVSAGLLTEPARTNQYLANTALDNVNWSVTNLTRTPGQIGIGGASTATRFTDTVDGSAVIHRFWQAVNVTNGLTYCASVYVKPETMTRLVLFSTSTLTFRVVFDFTDMSVSIDKDYGSEGHIEKCANGWYRCWIIKTAEATAVANIIHYMYDDLSDTYQGDGTKTFLIDHPQFEEGTGPSSPIVTAGAPVTRSADVPVLSGAGYTSVHNAAGITLLIETINQPGSTSNVISVSDNTANNEIRLSFGTTTSLIVASGGVNQATINNGRSKLIHTIDKYAIAVGTNSAVLVSNGEASTRDTSVTMPVSPDRITLGAINGNIMRVRMIPSVVATENLTAVTSPIVDSSKLLRIILDGNSLMGGVVGGEDDTPIAQVRGLLSSYKHVDIEDYAVGGQRTTDMLTDLANQIAPRIISDQTIVVVWEISNELIDSVPARTALDTMWSYCDIIRALGAKVILLNVLPRTDGVGGFSVARSAVNSLIGTESSAHVDAVVDVAGNATIGDDADATNTTYYLDGTHLAEPGNDIVASLLAPKITQIANDIVYPNISNLFLNPRWEGAVAGTPGTAPTSWSHSQVGTAATTINGPQITVTTTAGRQIMQQTITFEAGTYLLEVVATAVTGSTSLWDLILPNGGTSLTYFSNDVEVAGSTIITGMKKIGIRFEVATPAAIIMFVGVGLQGAGTLVYRLQNPSLRKIA